MLIPSSGALGVTLDRLGYLDAEDVQDRRHDVDGMVILVADLAAAVVPAGQETMQGSAVPPLNSYASTS